MARFKIFKKTALPKIIGLKNGYLFFVCTCGNTDKIHIKNYTNNTRCKICTLESIRVNHKQGAILTNDKEKADIFFNILMDNGLRRVIDGI